MKIKGKISLLGKWIIKRLSPHQSSPARGEGEKMDKAEAIAEIMRIAGEHGIQYIFFESRADAERLLVDMRYGHEARKVLADLGIKMPEPWLM